MLWFNAFILHPDASQAATCSFLSTAIRNLEALLWCSLTSLPQNYFVNFEPERGFGQEYFSMTEKFHDPASRFLPLLRKTKTSLRLSNPHASQVATCSFLSTAIRNLEALLWCWLASLPQNYFVNFEPERGFEPPTHGLQNRCSTN